ncbi:hypothetical protein BBK82_03570 [Lentzea guizhouensis]|uniref:Uncharacterized protein n=1 Tax=Lentzea guizhouensis TaxID=1586287 RepID=A0A1B2HC51_9PSEU|nr:hypothetical protein [Lentzea guizhouensis]ANZ35295.1 hypothetical protein BBK82_03570 [Lentzea guizhouensis]
MSTIHRQERTVHFVEQVVPVDPAWGACWVEVYKAVSALVAEMRATGRLGETQEPADDAIRFRITDDEIVAYYETIKVTR